MASVLSTTVQMKGALTTPYRTLGPQSKAKSRDDWDNVSELSVSPGVIKTFIEAPVEKS